MSGTSSVRAASPRSVTSAAVAVVSRVALVLVVLPLAVLPLAVLPAAARAQLPDASASTLALAGNHTALARGFGAISVNPAGLGMPESGFSLTIAPVSVRGGLTPVTLSDLADFEGRVVPPAVKDEWLARVIESGGQQGTVSADFTGLALTVGNVGVQLSTIASGGVDLPPGAVEALLYGNAGRTGEPVELSLDDGVVEGFSVSTLGVGVGLPVSPGLVLGVTGTYSLGHAMAVGRSVRGTVGSDPLRADLELESIVSCRDEIACTRDFVDGGSGVGLDLGAIFDLGGITVAASVRNVVNTFAWDETRLGYSPGTVFVEQGRDSTDFDERSFDDAPDELKALVRDYTFDPAYRLGAALDVSHSFTVTGDVQGRLSDDGLRVAPDHRVGVGAELRTGAVELRTGLSRIPDGFQYGAGVSLVLGPVYLSAAGGLERGALSDAEMVQLVLSFGNR